MLVLAGCGSEEPASLEREFVAQVDRPAANEHCDSPLPVCRFRSADAPVERVDVGFESFPLFLDEIGCIDKEFRPGLKDVRRETSLAAAQNGSPWHSGVVCGVEWERHDLVTPAGTEASLNPGSQTWRVDLFVQVPNPCTEQDVVQLLVLSPEDGTTDRLIVDDDVAVELRPETVVMTDDCRLEIGTWASVDSPDAGQYESSFDGLQYRLELIPDLTGEAN